MVLEVVKNPEQKYNYYIMKISMAEIGIVNELTVVKEVDFVVYLDG